MFNLLQLVKSPQHSISFEKNVDRTNNYGCHGDWLVHSLDSSIKMKMENWQCFTFTNWKSRNKALRNIGRKAEFVYLTHTCEFERMILLAQIEMMIQGALYF